MTESRLVSTGAESQDQGAACEGGLRKLVRVLKTSYTLMAVVPTQAHTFVKTHQTVHLKLVHFLVCKLYLKKFPVFAPSQIYWIRSCVLTKHPGDLSTHWSLRIKGLENCSQVIWRHTGIAWGALNITGTSFPLPEMLTDLVWGVVSTLGFVKANQMIPKCSKVWEPLA